MVLCYWRAVTRAPLLLLIFLAAACAQTPPPTFVRGSTDFEAAAARVVTRCYRPPRVASPAKQIITRLAVRYVGDGTLLGLPEIVAQTGITPANQPWATTVAEAARLAIIRCAPIPMPEALAGKGASLFLTFSPRRRA